ncbi:hypothetical protein KKF84_08005 [Myxococcota bacterium]|nr:hypothetical protein [Myxococcota bacterium]MBU1535250.1 hypothetical protein [Myxococcota bacterium]
MRYLPHALLMTCLLAAAPEIRAKSPQLEIRKQEVYSRISLPNLNTAFVKKRMKSGLTQRLLYKLSLYRKGEIKPLAGYIRYCKITYDLWDEQYTLVCVTPKSRVKQKFEKVKKLMAALATVSMVVMKKSQVVKTAVYSMKVNVQLNPISPKLLKKVRLWMRQSESAAVGTNYVGSFLSLFISKDIGGNDLNLDVTTKEVSGGEIPEK